MAVIPSFHRHNQSITWVHWVSWTMVNVVVVVMLKTYVWIAADKDSGVLYDLTHTLWILLPVILTFFPTIGIQWGLLRPYSGNLAIWLGMSLCAGVLGFIGSLVYMGNIVHLMEWSELYFVASDPMPEWIMELVIYAIQGVLFGAVLGVGQWIVLRRYVSQAWRWIAINSVSYGLAYVGEVLTLYLVRS